MSPAVTNHFRNACVPNRETESYLKDVTAQQVTIDEVFWGNAFKPSKMMPVKK